MLKKIILLLLLIFGFGLSNGQNSKNENKKFTALIYTTAFEDLYKICVNTRSDGVHRLCLAFMKKHKVRENKLLFYKFCTVFKQRALKANNDFLYRRIVLIELIQNLYFKNESLATAEKNFEQFYDDSISENDYSAALESLFEMVQFQQKKFKNDLKGLTILFFAEKFAEKYNLKKDYSYQGLLHKIGFVLWDLNKPVASTKYLIKALKTGNSIAIDTLVSLNAIGINYQKLGDLKTANAYYNAAISAAIKQKNAIFDVVIKGNQAHILFKLKQYNKAFNYANQDKNMCFNNGLLYNGLFGNAVGALNLMVKIELQLNNIAHAKTLLDSINIAVLAIEKPDYNALKRQKQANYLYYLKTKQFEPALAQYKSYAYFDSLFIVSTNKNKISDLQIKAATKLYNEDMHRKEWIKKIVFITKVFLGLLIVFCLSFFIFKLYKKISRVEHDKTETDKINIEQAKEINVLKIQLLAQLEIIKSNNYSYQIKVNASQNLGEENSNVNIENENVAFLKAYNLAQKEQWADFKNSFNTIYPNFEKNLAKQSSKFSSAETRLLMLHKLGLSNNEIATTLLISYSGVNKANYRLYKKIGVTTNQQLNLFIVSLLT